MAVLLAFGALCSFADTLAALVARYCFTAAAPATRSLTEDRTTRCIVFWPTATQLGMSLVVALHDGGVRVASRALQS